MKKVALLALSAFGMASAAGSLWGPNSEAFQSLQVQVPKAVECWTANPTPEESNPCYNSTGGWWFGYVGDAGTVSTKVKISGSFTNFGEGVSITAKADGSSLIDTDALKVQFSTAGGDPDAPAIAGIGFNYKKPEGPENITAKGGYCIVYSSSEALQFELGWDEATHKYDTWFATLPISANPKTVDLKWTGTSGTNTAGDFKKDGYAKTATENQPISKATDEAWSVKIRLKNPAATAVNADFNLFQLGWQGECGTVPVVSGNVAASAVNFNMVGKTLTLTSSIEKPVAVQVVNLHGAVVYTQTLTSASKVMNLSNLPTGVYMIRVPALGFTNKVILK